MDVIVRELERVELPKAMELVWEIFLEFEAPVYPKEGVEKFHSTIMNKEYIASICAYGAFIGGELLGVMATQNSGTHIALFFVSGKYHRLGIGRKLFEKVKSECPTDTLTVNASPCGVPVYHKFGFIDTDKEQLKGGLRFTPMQVKIL